MTNPEQASCPIDHSEAIPQVWMEETSQGILDDPNNTEEYLYGLKARLDDHYSKMLEHKPAKAAINIARKVRSAARGPVGAILNAYAVEVYNCLDYASQKQLVASCANDRTEYRSSYFNALYIGNAEPWMLTLVRLHDEATFQALHEDKELEYVFSNIKLADAFIYDQLIEAYKLDEDDEKTEFWGNFSLDWDIAESSRDNRAAIYRVMLAGYLALARSDELDPGNPHHVTNALQDNIEPISRLASVNRITSGEFLPRLNAPDSDFSPILFDDGGRDLDLLEDKFKYVDGELVPNHASLAYSAWRAPGNCAGRFKLRLPSERLAESIDDFFERIGHPEHGTDKDGKFSPVESFIALSAEIGRHSLFKPQGSPVLARLAIDNS